MTADPEMPLAELRLVCPIFQVVGTLPGQQGKPYEANDEADVMPIEAEHLPTVPDLVQQRILLVVAAAIAAAVLKNYYPLVCVCMMFQRSVCYHQEIYPYPAPGTHHRGASYGHASHHHLDCHSTDYSSIHHVYPSAEIPTWAEDLWSCS